LCSCASPSRPLPKRTRLPWSLFQRVLLMVNDAYCLSLTTCQRVRANRRCNDPILQRVAKIQSCAAREFSDGVISPASGDIFQRKDRKSRYYTVLRRIAIHLAMGAKFESANSGSRLAFASRSTTEFAGDIEAWTLIKGGYGQVSRNWANNNNDVKLPFTLGFPSGERRPICPGTIVKSTLPQS
jgi:hypothetical protein